jgi:putative ABC transport system ATP-binding protein
VPLSPAVPPLIDVRDVTKVYHRGAVEVAALRGVSFTVEPGEFVAIVGPSGSGKTTLLDLLGCLAQPTRGTYHFEGRPVHDLDDAALAALRNRRIGFVFQSFNLLPRLTALENVELPLVYARVPATERRARALEALEAVGLGERVDHRATELSGGQMQRVAVARALVGRPGLVLADEPTGNLDRAATADVMRLLADVHAAGNTIALITHDPAVAAAAERVLAIEDGRVVSDRLRETPRARAHAG